MNISRRYANVVALFETNWYLPRHVIDKGIAIFETLGTPEYSINRERFYAQREDESPKMLIPGTQFNPYSDDKDIRLLGRSGVHLTSQNVAIVPVYGILAKRMSDFDMSERGTSADMLADSFDILTRHADQIKGTVLDIASPGGSVLGSELAAQALLRLRGVMPVHAVCNEIMASGAYYIGCHVDAIHVVESSYIGSVGVFTTRVDARKFFENKGLEVHVISAGEFKVDGHPATPFTPEERARIQAEINVYYDLFVRAVMRGRDISEEKAKNLADGSLEIGANAVKRGFADSVSSLNDVVAEVERIGQSITFSTGSAV